MKYKKIYGGLANPVNKLFRSNPNLNFCKRLDESNMVQKTKNI